MTTPESLKAAITKSPATMLTAGATVAWMLSMVLRALRPDVPIGPAADGLMTTIAGYYFTDKGKGPQ